MLNADGIFHWRITLSRYLSSFSHRRLVSLASATDYVLPINSPCYLPQCQHNRLPWSIFFNFCQPLQELTQQNCAGSTACESWPGETASLGQFSTVTYSDAPEVDGIVIHAGQGTVGNGIARSSKITIACSNTSDPYPTFVHEATCRLSEYACAVTVCAHRCRLPPFSYIGVLIHVESQRSVRERVWWIWWILCTGRSHVPHKGASFRPFCFIRFLSENVAQTYCSVTKLT